MSKVFEALQKRAENDASSIILATLEGNSAPAAAETVTREAGPAAASEAAPRVAAVPEDLPGPMPASGVCSQVLQIPAGVPLLPFDNTHPHAAEQYRIIRTKLLQHPRQPRTILVSSAGPMDGKTVTAVNIAGALALKTEANVLLLEGDLRRPVLSLRLGIAAGLGLSDVLGAGQPIDDALVRIEQFPNLYLMVAGEPRSNPAELLDSSHWQALMAQFRMRFRYIIIDSPPMGRVADYDLLQAVSDGVVVVARQDHTGRHACLKTLEGIPKDKLLGVVMNCVAKWFLWRSQGYFPYGYPYGAAR